MTKECKECGHTNEDTAVHCNQCGAKLEQLQEDKESSKKEVNNNGFKDKLPLILAIISILIGLGEGLTTPYLFGIYDICAAILVVVIGGIIGLYLMKKEEYFISAIEFIAIAIVLCLCIGRMGLIGTILFVITAILLLYQHGKTYSSKKLLAIPALTIIIVFVILLVGGGISYSANQDSIEVGNITDNIAYSYGYYDGNVEGDIHLDSNFDYLEVNMDFYDASGKVVYSTIAWNEIDAEGGQTYHFSGMYIKEIQPTKVKITVSDNTNIFYNQTVDLTTS